VLALASQILCAAGITLAAADLSDAARTAIDCGKYPIFNIDDSMPAKYEHHLPLHKPEEDADAAEAREATTQSLLAALPAALTMPVAVAIPQPVAIPRNLAQPQGSQAQGSHDLVPAVTFFGEEEMPTSGGQVTDTLGSPGGTGGAYLNARAARMNDNAAFMASAGFSPLK
jgi:hypothetical protein